MKHLLKLICLVCLLTACHRDDPEPWPEPQPIDALYITDSVRYEAEHMTAYNYVYPSTAPNGRHITLSATITLGDSVKQSRSAMGFILYNHYSIFRADQCPTRGELAIQKTLAQSPLITVSPDYYGFGVTEECNQAYCMSESNAVASVDALKGAKELLANMGYSWGDNLFNVGYSQGGQTAVGVTRWVAQHCPDINITSTLAGAGPYDMAATYGMMMQNTMAAQPSNIIGVLLAYNEFSQLGMERPQMFLEPVLSHIDDWFYSKRYTRQEIDAMIGTQAVEAYLSPALLDFETELSQRLIQALESDNQCQGWTPRSNESIYLFHNTDDNVVPVVNTVNLYQHLISAGATQVTLDTAAYGSSATVNGHDIGALFFIVNATNIMCNMLGIESWMAQ